MKTIRFHPAADAHLSMINARGAAVTPCGWQTSKPGDAEMNDNGTVTCEACLAFIAGMMEAMGPTQATALYFHSDYGNDDACDTLLAVFADPADAERNLAAMTAGVPHYDRSVHSYKTELCDILPKGSDYTGSKFG